MEGNGQNNRNHLGFMIFLPLGSLIAGALLTYIMIKPTKDILELLRIKAVEITTETEELLSQTKSAKSHLEKINSMVEGAKFDQIPDNINDLKLKLTSLELEYQKRFDSVDARIKLLEEQLFETVGKIKISSETSLNMIDTTRQNLDNSLANFNMSYGPNGDVQRSLSNVSERLLGVNDGLDDFDRNFEPRILAVQDSIVELERNSNYLNTQLANLGEIYNNFMELENVSSEFEKRFDKFDGRLDEYLKLIIRNWNTFIDESIRLNEKINEQGRLISNLHYQPKYVKKDIGLIMDEYVATAGRSRFVNRKLKLEEVKMEYQYFLLIYMDASRYEDIIDVYEKKTLVRSKRLPGRKCLDMWDRDQLERMTNALDQVRKLNDVDTFSYSQLSQMGIVPPLGYFNFNYQDRFNLHEHRNVVTFLDNQILKIKAQISKNEITHEAIIPPGGKNHKSLLCTDY